MKEGICISVTCDNDSLIRRAIQIGTETALNQIEQTLRDIVEEKKKRNIQNIKIIVHNYKRIKLIAESYELQKVHLVPTLDWLEELYNVILSERMISQMLTEKNVNLFRIYKHFNISLKIFEEVCKNSGKPEDSRCYEILEELYILDNTTLKYRYSGDKFDKISVKYYIDKRTIYKDLEKSYKLLSLLFYGNLFC